jgi:hypothetical protein
MIKKISYFLLITLALLTAYVIYLISPLGINSSITLINKILPGNLSYDSAEGSIIGSIKFKNLSYTNKKIQITAETLNLNWHPLSLLHRTINLSYINSNNLHINVSYAPSSKQEPSNNKYYYTIINKSLLKNLQLSVNDKDLLNIQQSQISGKILNDQIKLKFINKHINNTAITTKSEIKGTLEKYQFSTQILNKDSSWQLTGNGTPNSAHFKTVNSQLLGGTLNGEGNIDWSKENWSGTLKADNLNLTELNKNLPNNTHIYINTDGHIKNNSPLEYEANAHIYNKGNDIKVKINKHIKTDISWSTHLQNLHALYKNLSGKINSTGKLSYDKKISSSGSLTSKNLSYKNTSTKNISSDWKIQNDSFTHAKINIGDLKFNTLNINNLKANLEGNDKKHHANIKFKINNTDISAISSGTTEQNKLTETIHKLTIQHDKTIMHIKKEIPITYNNNNLDVPLSCLYGKTNEEICAKFHSDNMNTWSGDLTTKNVLLNTTINAFNKNIHINTSINTSTQITGDKRNIKTIQSLINMSNGSLQYSIDQLPYSLHFNSFQIHPKLANKKLVLTSNIALANKSKIHADININNFDFKTARGNKQKIKGKITVSIPDLTQFNNLLPLTLIESGSLQAEINTSGSTLNPNITGTVSTKNNKIFFPTIGMEVNNLKSSVKTNNKIMLTNTDVIIHGKPLNISSKTNLDKNDLPTIAQITGDNILMANTTKYHFIASPNLIFSYFNHQPQITGQIDFNNSKLDLTTFDNAISIPTDDIVYTNNKNHDSLLKNIEISIGVNIDNDNTITGFGLNSTVTGYLHLTHSKLKPYQASDGDIQLKKGTLAAYGHTLKINPGSSITYSNSALSNPQLNVKASETVDTASTPDNPVDFSKYEVGVSVSGSLNNKQIDLYSSPDTLSKQDILSLLLFGYTYKSDADNPGILQALGALQIAQSGIESSGGIAEALRSSLGLSELGINQSADTDAIGNTINNSTSTFIIGKYLNKHTYIRYLRDLSSINQSQVIQLKLILNNKFSLQLSEIMQDLYTNQRIDLLYSRSK